MSDIVKKKIYKLEEHENNTGKLTAKGAVLELYFGQYIKEYLTENKFINGKNIDKIGKKIYANAYQRTVTTAQALSLGMFPGLNVVPHVEVEYGKMDPVFQHNIVSNHDRFREIFKKSEKALKKMDEMITKNYELLKDLIDYEEGSDEGERYYGRVTLNSEYFNPAGLFNLYVELAGNLMLQYYEGIEIEKLLDGRVRTFEELKGIFDLREEYMKIKHENEEAAQHMVLPLLKYIHKYFFGNNTEISLMVGHDCNIFALLSAMGVKEYRLNNQFEYSPVGGKMFLELWEDRTDKKKKINMPNWKAG